MKMRNMRTFEIMLELLKKVVCKLSKLLHRQFFLEEFKETTYIHLLSQETAKLRSFKKIDKTILKHKFIKSDEIMVLSTIYFHFISVITTVI